MFEAARQNLAAQKPSVDRLELSQLGMSRRLLNPQLYELHDDLSETTWTTDSDEQTHGTAEKSAVDRVDEQMIDDKVNAREFNGQSTSDQEEIWSDCTAELPLSDNRKLEISSSLENSNLCTAEKTDGNMIESELAGKTVDSLKTDVECRLTVGAKRGKEALITSDLPERVTTNHLSATSCTAGTVTNSVVVTATSKPFCAVSTKPPTTTTNASRTTACTTSSTTTTSSSKSERPRASPCRATQTKQMPPVTNGRDTKPPPCKAAAAKQSSPLTGAATAKLIADMVGRSKSSAGAGGQCKLTQCVDKIHTDPVNVATTDNGSCSSDKTTSRVSSTAAAAPGANNTASEGRKDGSKFCECWHCEFFGHMSVS